MHNGFGKVSSIILRNPNISIGAKGLYAYLSSFADARGELFVSVYRMAEENDVSESTIKRLLTELREKNIIQRKTGLKKTTITRIL